MEKLRDRSCSEDVFKAQQRVPALHPSVTALDLEMKHTYWVTVTLQLNHLSYTIKLLSHRSQIHGNTDKVFNFIFNYSFSVITSIRLLSTFPCPIALVFSILVNRGKSHSPSFKCPPNVGLQDYDAFK